MNQKVKILNKYSIDAIDYEFEKKRLKSQLKNKIEALGVSLDEIKKMNQKEKKTEDEQNILDSFINIEKEYSDGIDYINKYKELVITPAPNVSDIDQLVSYYEEVGDKVHMLWEVIKNEPNRVFQKIELLKKQLSDGDYKIIKCYEADMLGKKYPYELEEIVNERNNIRKEINDLQNLISDETKFVSI